MQAKVREDENFPGVFWLAFRDGTKRLATRNLAEGISVYGEQLVRVGETEYRTWDPYRSKLAAAIFKNLKKLPITAGCNVLYLGSASGTTASHVSDIIDTEGKVYCVEFSQRSMRQLIDTLCQHRVNVYPILADARQPESYRSLITGPIDVIYSDVAQPDQTKILADNTDIFLKHGGQVMIAIKSRSIDVTMDPTTIINQEIKNLSSMRFTIKQILRLEPYERDHAMILASRP